MTGLIWRSLALLAAAGVLAVVAGSAFAQEWSAADLMAGANERYERGEYEEAAQQYEALVERGYRDAAVYFNLGNAYLESGDLGRAILSYLRARELSPRDPDIKANLDEARGMTVDRLSTERDSLVESVSHFGRSWVTPVELGIGALLLWMASGMGISSLLVWQTFPLRRALRAATVLLTVAAMASFLLLVSMLYANPYDNTGVVTAASVEVVSGPGTQYADEFTIHSGAQVRLADSRRGWQQVALPGGELEGWLPARAIEAVGRGDGE